MHIRVSVAGGCGLCAARRVLLARTAVVFCNRVCSVTLSVDASRRGAMYVSLDAMPFDHSGAAFY